MLTLEEDRGLLRIRAGGRLGPEDHDRLAPVFAQLAEGAGAPVPILVALDDDFCGSDLGVLWRHLAPDPKRREAIGRIAVIGPRRWEEWVTTLSDPRFPNATLCYFDTDQGDAAESWARGGPCP